ncbi:HIT domain-containing protein [Pseudoclavibacter sp. CFCC 13796]|uniref:HIT domain-containing protein n=1 Tax=Pseudoclavibacter sp. CFCC 13796 TaxID=2615179 RepID=UPI0013013145|nr:HIT domain-containing protein [Pseudoclavibacter sp. CFCC 13796]KAB1661510.1 HIT domain-containing protein [Pseudoclavibacter sp. CFCC 13796]
MSAETPSIFSKIIDREIPADIVAETDDLIAIRDINPQAELHLLVIPKSADFRDVVELAEEPELLAKVVKMAGDLARQYADGEFRLVFNTGAAAGQSVFHVHAHVLAGPTLDEGKLV